MTEGREEKRTLQLNAVGRAAVIKYERLVLRLLLTTTPYYLVNPVEELEATPGHISDFAVRGAPFVI
jgi:hypothetical protein